MFIVFECNLLEINNLVLGYELSLNAKDALTLDLEEGLINILMGYKIK